MPALSFHFGLRFDDVWPSMSWRLFSRYLEYLDALGGDDDV